LGHAYIKKYSGSDFDWYVLVQRMEKGRRLLFTFNYSWYRPGRESDSEAEDMHAEKLRQVKAVLEEVIHLELFTIFVCISAVFCAYFSLENICNFRWCTFLCFKNLNFDVLSDVKF